MTGRDEAMGRVSPAHACMFCDEWLEEGDTCEFCAALLADGAEARRKMVPMDACPWENGQQEVVHVLGDPEYHGIVPLGLEASCPWCTGWANEERRLYEAVTKRREEA